MATVNPAAITDTDLIDRYIASLKWRNRSITTQDMRRSYLLKSLREIGSFSEWTAHELQDWLGDPERDLKPQTQSLLLTTFDGFFKWARKENLLKKNPCKKIDKPKGDNEEHHPISDEDLAKAFANADTLTACWLALGAYSGLRCQEIALISREDIYDDETKRLFVAHGKGAKTRWVPLTPQLKEVLNAWKGMPAEGRLWFMTPQQMSKALNAYLHDEIETASTAHSLRHFFASKLYQSTRDIRLVQILLGHSSIATTQRYAKADMSIAFEAASTISFAPKAPELEIQEMAA